MAAMSERDKRTLRLAAVGITLYLICFFGWRGYRLLEGRRADYVQLVKNAQALKQELQPYENKTLLLEKLKANFRLDPAKLSKATLVAEASAAIQKAAMSGGIQLGPIRESPARSSAKELASVQLEAQGPAPALLALLPKLEALGYPLVIESAQFTAEPMRPGMVKLNLTILILDYEQWKKEEVRHV